MNIVMVKHNESKKLYCFEVPESIAPLVVKGVHLICKTSHGNQRGVAVTGLISGAGAEDIARQHGARFPLAKVVSACSNVKMSDITVPVHIAQSIPSTEKIAKRLNEWKRNKTFDTRVVVKNGQLIDGYSAYLVARMLGLKYLAVNNV